MTNIQQQVIIQSIEHQKIGIKDDNELLFCPSNVSIMAVANLNTADYNPSKSIEQNVRINLDLISKFDLVFLLDENVTHYDELIYEKEIKRLLNFSESSSALDDTLKELMELENNSLNEKIFQDGNLLSPQIIYKYILYCFDYVHPAISANMKSAIQYSCVHEINSTVTSKLRIYETICRLAEAHAKLFMRQEVSEQDLSAVIEIIQSSLTLAQVETRKNRLLLLLFVRLLIFCSFSVCSCN